SAFALWYLLGTPHRPGATARKIRRSTLVLPGATDAELAHLAGALIFYRIRALRSDLSAEVKERITVLLWRSAAFIVMAQRGAGPATRRAWDGCAAAIVAYARTRPGTGSPPPTAEALWGKDSSVDDHLLRFLSGPGAPLSALVAAALPELG